MKRKISNLQIGKNGITKGFYENLKNRFNTTENVKVSILKSDLEDRKKIKDLAEEIVDKLGENYTYRIIGFTIVIKKWRKPRR